MKIKKNNYKFKKKLQIQNAQKEYYFRFIK